jgi:hypothetical protein
MIRSQKRPLILTALLALFSLASGEDKVVYKPLKIGAFHEVGSVVKGIYEGGGGVALEK